MFTSSGHICSKVWDKYDDNDKFGANMFTSLGHSHVWAYVFISSEQTCSHVCDIYVHKFRAYMFKSLGYICSKV